MSRTQCGPVWRYREDNHCILWRPKLSEPIKRLRMARGTFNSLAYKSLQCLRETRDAPLDDVKTAILKHFMRTSSLEVQQIVSVIFKEDL